MMNKITLVRERLDFNREGTPLQKAGVGRKRPGQPKDFEDVKPGDIAMDYNDEELEVVDKFRIVFGPGGSLPEEAEDFLRRYDDTGAMDEYFETWEPEEGDTEDIIAVNDFEEGMTYIFSYGPDGAVAIW